MASVPAISARGSVRTVRLFDGVNKVNRSWDGLRKDDELWVENGDCLVHFYAPGSSRRGASLRVSLQKLQETGSHFLLRECLHKPTRPSSTSSDEDDNSDSGYAPSNSSNRNSQCSEVYVPAPVELTRQEAFLYHIGTRNYFAYLLNKPIVGESFILALAHLWTRVQSWQSKGVAAHAFQRYCQEQGYMEFAGNLDYAAAALYWSEQAREKEIWLDAFVHCVGMYDLPDRYEKTKMLSSTTRGLLYKASLGMHLNVSRAVKSLGTFLEEELGPEHLGLSKQSRDHLDRFRSTLHTYYIREFGYFPPGPRMPWDKRLWLRIYDDFHCLYKYLADTESSSGMNGHGLNGGICVMQNVKAFDESHSFSPLKHPLPLMPESPARRRTLDARRGFNAFTKARGESEPDLLAQAANSKSSRVMTNDLVKAYIGFERQKLTEKVTVAEARKVRWLLVYGVLQMLISVTKAPQEVRDTQSVSYPLCVSLENCPPWADDVQDLATVEQVAARISAELDIVSRSIADDTKISIQPDCEAETAEDYFSSGQFSRRDSQVSLSMTPPPLRPAPLSRANSRTSIRSGVNSIRRSVVGSIARRNSQHILPNINSSPSSSVRAKPGSYREIVIEGYGNGADASNFSRTYPHISGLQMHQLNTLLENSSEAQHVSPASSLSSSMWSSRSGDSTASSVGECSESPGTEISFSSTVEPKSLRVIPTGPIEELSAFEFGFGKNDDSPRRPQSMVFPPVRTSSKFGTTGFASMKRTIQ